MKWLAKIWMTALVGPLVALVACGCSPSTPDGGTTLTSAIGDAGTSRTDLSAIQIRMGGLLDEVVAGVEELSPPPPHPLTSPVFDSAMLADVRSFADLVAQRYREGEWLSAHECLVCFQHRLCGTVLRKQAREGVMRELLDRFVDESGLAPTVGRGFCSIDAYMQALQKQAPDPTLERMSTLFNSCRCGLMGFPATWKSVAQEYGENPGLFITSPDI